MWSTLQAGAYHASNAARVYGRPALQLAQRSLNTWGNRAMANADKLEAATDFALGLYAPDPPPNSYAGYAGWGAGKIKDKYDDGTLEDLWDNRDAIVPYITTGPDEGMTDPSGIYQRK